MRALRSWLAMMSLLVATAARAPKAATASVAKKTAKRVWNGPGGSVILKRNQTALPSKFGQRLTTLRVSQPQLLMLYHIEKTGGSSVFRWLQRQMREPQPLKMLLDTIDPVDETTVVHH